MSQYHSCFYWKATDHSVLFGGFENTSTVLGTWLMLGISTWLNRHLVAQVVLCEWPTAFYDFFISRLGNETEICCLRMTQSRQYLYQGRNKLELGMSSPSEWQKKSLGDGWFSVDIHTTVRISRKIHPSAGNRKPALLAYTFMDIANNLPDNFFILPYFVLFFR